MSYVHHRFLEREKELIEEYFPEYIFTNGDNAEIFIPMLNPVVKFETRLYTMCKDLDEYCDFYVDTRPIHQGFSAKSGGHNLSIWAYYLHKSKELK